jgi:hypothetical protein
MRCENPDSSPYTVGETARLGHVTANASCLGTSPVLKFTPIEHCRTGFLFNPNPTLSGLDTLAALTGRPLRYRELAALGIAVWSPAGLSSLMRELINAPTGLPGSTPPSRACSSRTCYCLHSLSSSSATLPRSHHSDRTN